MPHMVRVTNCAGRVADGRIVGASHYNPRLAGNPLFQNRHDVGLV
jgi:hypothetical protein